MSSDKKTKAEPQYAADQYSAEKYAVNDYAAPADYTAAQEQYPEGQQYADYSQYDYSDPSSQYYVDPNKYYYDYTTGQYVEINAATTAVEPSAASYNYDQYYAQQAYFDQAYSQPTKSAYSNGAPLPEAVTAIQNQATATGNKYGQQSAYGSSATPPPKVYYPSTANANNPVGPIIITKSGYSGPNTESTQPATGGGGAIPGGEELKKKGNKKKSAVRAAGGEVWEDKSLEDWDDNDFRLFAGDLGNEVTEEILFKAFSKYPSLLRTRVVRDTRTMKSKGFGFISFKDPDDFVKAWREMNGKYVGNRPIKLRKSTWKERNVDVRAKKERDRIGAYAKKH